MDKMPRHGPVLWSGKYGKCSNSHHVQFHCNELHDGVFEDILETAAFVSTNDLYTNHYVFGRKQVR
jgi:hypothetical protein